MDTVTFKLTGFEGPLDLLLHLIQKNKVSIYDIPISLIADQYMEYIGQMQEMDLELTGEFLVMAAHLLLIKSKLLIPSYDESDTEEDPRTELIDRLLEYQKYKNAVEYLSTKQNSSQHMYFKQPDKIEPNKPHYESISMPLSVLMNALRDVLERQEYRAPVKRESFGVIVKRETVSVRLRLRHLMDMFKQNRRLNFSAVFNGCGTRAEVVSTFLALLELIRSGKVLVFLNKNDIICSAQGDMNEFEGNAGYN